MVMNLLFSDILGIPVRYSHTRGTPAMIKNVIIDHETGKICAFCTRFNCENIITAQDIVSIHRKKIVVSDMHSIIPRSEVVRIDAIYRKGIRFYGNSVYDEAGDYLGRVIDMELNTSGMFLASIVVAKGFLFWSYNQKIIAKKHIVEVKKDKIIVKNSFAEKKIEKSELVEAPV